MVGGGSRNFPADIRVANKLQRPQPINFEDNKLETVIEYLRNTTGENFYVNWSALEAAGVRRDTKITLRLRGVPVEKILDIVLEQANVDRADPLGWIVTDGIVVVSSLDDLDTGQSTPIYEKGRRASREDRVVIPMDGGRV